MKMKLRIIASTLLVSSASMAIAGDQDSVVATVNGQDIKNSTLQFYALERRQGNDKKTIAMDQLVNDLVDMTLLKKEALKNKLDQEEGYKARIDFINLSLLSQAGMINYLDNNPIPDKQLRKEYDSKIGEIKFTEFKASHILLKDEKTAKEVIAKLKAGGKFFDLAKTYSTGPTAPKGGDLGWFAPQRMVPAFSKAVSELKTNEFTQEALKTQFGWHVILRTGDRKGTPPKFEDVKAQIAGSLEQEQIQKYINGLRKGAKITINKPE